jgi:germination protein YpeB
MSTTENRDHWYDRVEGGASTVWILLLSLALVVSLAWGIGQYQARRAQAIGLEMERQRAFEQLLDRAENIEVLLAKGLVTTSGCSGSLVFTDLWHQGLAAQEDLADLPLAYFSTGNLSRFVTQVADFSHYLVRKCSQGGEMTDEDWNHLSQLHQAAGEMTLELHEIAQQAATGAFRWSLLASPQGPAGTAAVQVQDRFGDIAAHMQDLPTLIYDGPFSDHIDLLVPKGLQEGTVTAEQAAAEAKRFAPSLPGAVGQQYEAVQVGDVPGPVSAYAFALRPMGPAPGTPAPPASGAAVRATGQTTTGPEIRIDVSKEGGQVVWFLVQGLPDAVAPPLGTGGGAPAAGPGQATGADGAAAAGAADAAAPGAPGDVFGMQKDLQQAIEQARRFLESRGFTGMIATYSAHEDEAAVCQFAAAQDGVVLYPDLMQVKVRIADGQILGYNGIDFIMSHTRRDLPRPAVSVAQAQAKLNPRVTVVGQRLALIPTPALGEILCREFHVTLNGDPFLVYINAATGEEEAIFKIIAAPEGGSWVL